MISPLQATLLGVVEGLTEFLPVSSTGHLILASRWLRLHGEGVAAFTVVIQAGSLAAVAGCYRARVASMWRGLRGRDPAGRGLLVKLLVGFLPVAVAGLWLHRIITQTLFSTWPVVAALGLGGVVMVGVDAWMRSAGRRGGSKTLEAMTRRDALLIGIAQCLSLWPGTSRAMVTILAGLLVGLPAAAAAEYSFLLALPTLGAATLFDAAANAGALIGVAGPLSMLCGLAAAALVAACSIRGFVRYVARRGVALFGWYRIGLAAVVWVVAA